MIKKAFTMAEILISLTIIGVIAVLVLPSISNETSSQQFLATYKKTFSVLNQAVDTNYAMTGMDFAGNRDNYGTIVGDILVNRLGATLEDKNLTWTISGSVGSGFISDCVEKGFADQDEVCVTNSSISLLVGTSSNNTMVYTLKDGLASIILLGATLDKDDNKLKLPMPCKAPGQRMAVPIKNGSTTTFSYTSDAKYCLAYLDVNGPKGPNQIVSCANGRLNDGKITSDITAKDCIIPSSMVTDVFPILIYGDTVAPATPAGAAIFQERFTD